MRATMEDWALFILRVGAGLTFLLHGYPKLFAGAGPLTFSRYLHAQHFPAPLFFAWIFALVEVFGGLALIAGIQTKYAAGALAGERIITILGLKMARGVAFMASRGIGWELDFLLLCMAIGVYVLGPGAITVQTFLPMVQARRRTA
ncbi:MAG TPA: DoxX family protein [bacterium]